jgi:CheY-like chemotaxis protein
LFRTVSQVRKPVRVEKKVLQTILVVEDDTMVRMPISEFLRSRGYKVLEASSAAEAIATLLSGAAVNIVFSDIRMPGKLDGLGLAEWCRANRPALPVLLTSGYSGVSNPLAAAFPGSGFIEKPYSQIQVETRVAALLKD